MRRAPRPRFLDNTGLTAGDLAWLLGGTVFIVVAAGIAIAGIRLIDLPPVPTPPAAVPGPGGGR